jgi:hypothetical protein
MALHTASHCLHGAISRTAPLSSDLSVTEHMTNAAPVTVELVPPVFAIQTPIRSPNAATSRSATPSDCTDTVNGDAITAAVERQPCKILCDIARQGGLSVGRDLEVSQIDLNRRSQNTLLPDFCPACVTKRRLLFDLPISCCIRRQRLSRRVCVPGNTKWNLCAKSLSLCTV